MKKKILSVLLALVLALSLSLVAAAPVAAAVGESIFTVADGTYTTTVVDAENGTIEATLTGSWGEPALSGDFTATGEGSLYLVPPPTSPPPDYGSTANISVSGTLSALEITFSGTAVRISGDPITDDLVTDITGSITIQTDGAVVADLAGTVMVGEVPMNADIDITGSMVTEPWLTKANILKASGVPGTGLDKAPGLRKPFNPNSKAGEHAGKK